MGNVSVFKPNDEGLGFCFTIPQLATTPQTNQIHTNPHQRLLPFQGSLLALSVTLAAPKTVPWVDGSPARHRYESAFATSRYIVWLSFVSEWANCIYFQGFRLLFPCLHLRWVTYHGCYPSHPQKTKCVSPTASIKVTLNQRVSAVCSGGGFFLSHSFCFLPIPPHSPQCPNKHEWQRKGLV